MTKITAKENANGTTTVKVAKGAKVTTSTGKVAKGGQIIDTVKSSRQAKKVVKESKKVFDEFDDDLDDDFEDFDSNIDEMLDDEAAAPNTHLYITKDGIIGNVIDDGLQIVDTSGIDEEGIEELADSPADEREELANELRSIRGGYVSTKHYFNDSGDFGSVKNLKIIDGGALTKSEMSNLIDSEDPFSESNNYDTSGFNIVSALRQVKQKGHAGTADDLLNDELIIEGTSY